VRHCDIGDQIIGTSLHELRAITLQRAYRRAETVAALRRCVNRFGSVDALYRTAIRSSMANAILP